MIVTDFLLNLKPNLVLSRILSPEVTALGLAQQSSSQTITPWAGGNDSGISGDRSLDFTVLLHKSLCTYHTAICSGMCTKIYATKTHI